MLPQQRAAVSVVFFFLWLSPTSANECGCSLVTTFMALISGEYSNAGDLGRERPPPAQDEVNLILYEVDIPAFKPDRVLYFEERLNSNVLRQEVIVVGVSDEGFIQTLSHNFTLPAGSGNFSTSLLSDLPLSAFSSRPECVSIYRPMEYNIFIGTYPDCTGHFDGQVASYAVMLSCNSIATVTSFNLFPEASSHIPYSMWKISSLPLLSYGSCGESILDDICTC
ncbi:uncharacterized protein LOC131942917 isoform X2 [Physella acuta]|uniref:uncharacterized protein LOC131942917 isoform X2 n=1 Tax=Physella acuta TaxID=109671 RepID=UPI0027DE1052|nr:uncharacterized protein LOC131942917 isoform X2 [Physella acuta]